MRDLSVDLNPKALTVRVAEWVGFNARGGGEFLETFVDAGEARGGSGYRVEVGIVELWQAQPLEDEEVEVSLDIAASLPVEWQAVHQPQTGCPVDVCRID